MTTTPPDSPALGDDRSGFWQRRLIQPIKTQLSQGVSPQALTWAIIAALTTGVFPILGTTTLLGLASGVIFRLNQAVIHSINLLCYPLHILLILPFIRLGEKILGADPVTFSISDMLVIFKDSPTNFFSQYGATCLHCIFAWPLVVPILVAALYPAVLPLMKRIASRNKS